MISCPTGKRWTRPRCTIDKYLRVGGVGNYNSRRTGDGRRRRGALPDKQREARGGTAWKQKKNMSRETQKPMPARAGGLWAACGTPKTVGTGSIQKYAAVVPVAVVCRCNRRGYGGGSNSSRQSGFHEELE